MTPYTIADKPGDKPGPLHPQNAKRKNIGETVFRGITAVAAASVLALAITYLVQMVINSWESVSRYGWGFVTGTTWDPVFEEFGALPFR